MNPPLNKVYLVRDERANRYGTPMVTPLPGEAVADSYRSSIFNNLGKAAPLADSVIYEVGTFDTVTGQIVCYKDFILVARLGDYVKEALAYFHKETAPNE